MINMCVCVCVCVFLILLMSCVGVVLGRSSGVLMILHHMIECPGFAIAQWFLHMPFPYELSHKQSTAGLLVYVRVRILPTIMKI